MIDFILYYGLEKNPFEKGNDGCVVEGIDYREVMGRLNYLKEIKGIGLITGRPGVGKTFAVKQFCDSLNQGLYRVVYVSMSTLSVVEFYRELSMGFGLESYAKKIDNYRSLQDHIRKMAVEKRVTPVIVVDEAQYLNTEILNDLKMLLNFDFDSKNHAIVILVGLTNLESILKRAVHEALRQRVVIQYQIIGIDENEVKNYIETKLKDAGRVEPLFDEGALHALANACQGSSRKLNNIITQSLIIGATRKKQMIDNTVIMEAVNEI